MATKTTIKSSAKKTKKDVEQTATDAAETAKQVGATALSKVGQLQDALFDTAGDLKESAQRIFMAGLGALSVAEDEGSKYFKKLIKKGEKYGTDNVGTDTLKKLREGVDDGVRRAQSTADAAVATAKKRTNDAQESAGSAADRVETMIQEAVTAAMKRVGVPTREEIMALSRSVERLTTQVDSVRTRKAKEKATVEVDAVGGGWFDVKIGGITIEKVRGKDAAEEVAERLRTGSYTEHMRDPRPPTSVEIVQLGGGWFHVKVAGVVVERVQGREAAEAAADKLSHA
ncbi:hypothetical protein BH23BAC4_BH23BAC4_02300 [soil metagenome]